MIRTITWGLAGLACVTLLVDAAPAKALVAAPAPMPQRVANAELLVVGKLGKVEDKNISATPAPGAKDKVEYQVIALHVEKVLLGKADKELRLAFIPPQNPRAGDPVPIRPGRPFRGGVVFSGGQEGVFFLTKHHAENFYVAPIFSDFLDKKNNTYDTELDTIKRCVQLLEDPNKSLQAKDAEDRLFTAAMLLTRYNVAKPGWTKQVPIEAEQSKLILNAIAEADWTPPKPKPGVPFYAQVNAQQVFNLLRIQPKDGWTPPADPAKFADAAKAWLKQNADKFRVMRTAPENPEK
jgi:hypothetical protein